MLNSQWLNTFTVLCETGHFTQTAHRLAMTQPGVSQHLRKLEDQVGQPLISRQGKSFSPTPAGEAVLALGLERHAQEKRLRDVITRDNPYRGDVVVGCSGSFAMLLYPHLLQVMQSAPDLVIYLKAMPQNGVIKGVLKGEIDLGIADHAPNHARLDAQLIGQEELCLVLPDTVEPRSVTFAMLDDIGFIAHPDGYAYADELFSLNFPDVFKGSEQLKVRGFVNQISQIPVPVAQGIGYTILPRSGVNSFSENHRLHIANLCQKSQHDLYLVCQRGRQLARRITRIAELVKSTAEKLDAT